MGEELTISDYDITGGDDGHRAMDWETGLPNVDDLPPLSHFLISPELASAFNITPEPHRSMIDVTRASHKTLSTLRYHPKQHLIDKHHKLDDFESFSDDRAEEIVIEGEEIVDLIPEGSDSRKLQRVDSGDGSDESTVKTSKRNRLVWTPQLHRRFVEVVAHLGVKNAVPKTIMQLMNVEGLTRENVASHLQKYRLYVKRMHGSSNEGSSKADNQLNGSGGVTYPTQMVHMPYPPTPQMVPNSASGGNVAYRHGLEYSYPYNMNMMMQPKDCSGNNFGSVSPYQHPMTSNDK